MPDLVVRPGYVSSGYSTLVSCLVIVVILFFCVFILLFFAYCLLLMVRVNYQYCGSSLDSGFVSASSLLLG